MLALSINRIRDFDPQAAVAPVGLMRGMRWRSPNGEFCICAGDRYT